MIAGRLKIINESRYPTEEVEPLVRFGLQEIDLKGEKLLVVVSDTRKCAFRGWANRARLFDGSEHVYKLGRRFKADYINHLLLGSPEQFPIRPFERNGTKHDFQTWQEALVALAAHEGMHAQHYYDSAYEKPEGRRRVGVERIEPKCEAFEAYMLRQYRSTLTMNVV